MFESIRVLNRRNRVVISTSRRRREKVPSHLYSPCAWFISFSRISHGWEALEAEAHTPRAPYLPQKLGRLNREKKGSPGEKTNIGEINNEPTHPTTNIFIFSPFAFISMETGVGIYIFKTHLSPLLSQMNTFFPRHLGSGRQRLVGRQLWDPDNGYVFGNSISHRVSMPCSPFQWKEMDCNERVRMHIIWQPDVTGKTD